MSDSVDSASSSGNVLITGASSGIGYATALQLAKRGFRVFGGIRKQLDGDRLVEASNGAVEPITIDVAEPKSVLAAASRVYDLIGGDGALRGIVNNAGFPLEAPLEFIDRDAFRYQLEVNVVGLADVTKAFLPMLERPGGRVVNVSSGAGEISVPLSGAYSASKYAVEAMSDALRVEIRNQGLFVSLIVPGFIDSPIHEKNARRTEEMLAGLPEIARRRYGPAFEKMRENMNERAKQANPPEDVANAIQKALMAPRPKARYPVTPEAHLLSIVGGFLSARMRDAIFGRDVGL